MTSEPSEPVASTGPVLHFLQGLLAEGKPSSLAGILDGLVHAFAADGAGLLYPLNGPAHLSQASWVSEPVDDFPWEKNAAIFEQVKSAETAVALRGTRDTSWLLTSVGQPGGRNWLLWLVCCGARNWSNGETAALALAGECLARHVAKNADAAAWMRAVQRAQLQEGIERTAAVTTRLAHDFGNVLTGILGFAELALPHTKADSLPHRYLSEVLGSARQGAQWVQKLQSFSRRFQPKALPTALASILKVEAGKSHWQSGIALKVELPPELPALEIAPDSLQQAMSAFLDNAREAISGPGTVAVGGQLVELGPAECLELLGNNRPGAHVELTITDSGNGIPAAVQEKLFREFFASTKGKRRGLGLAVAYGILHSFQAGFRMRSLAGQGTTVQIYVPVSTKVQASKAAPVKLLGQSRILVVDDDPLILRILSHTLEGAGYQVRTAAGPREAIAQVAQAAEPFQLVLTDVVMPEFNGLEMARRMLSRDPGIHFLFISSQSHQDPLLARFPFLSKPFESPALLRVVGAALGASAHDASSPS